MWFDELEKKLKKQDSLEGREWIGTTSVLALIGEHKDRKQLEILLTKRTMLVETHKGQISFPGGYYESSDGHSLQTALRETEEEIGLGKEHIQIIGRLEPVQTRNNVQIFPWVGVLALPFNFKVNSAEVESLIYFPVAKLLEPGLLRMEIDVMGKKISSIGTTYEGHIIWGATAMMLQELAALIASR